LDFDLLSILHVIGILLFFEKNCKNLKLNLFFLDLDNSPYIGIGKVKNKMAM